MRIFAISDIHVDFKANWEYLERIVSNGLIHGEYIEDAVIVAGDISHLTRHVSWALHQLGTVFKYVFFCVGNHELWITAEEKAKKMNSLDKYEEMMKVATKAGAIVSRKEILTKFHTRICVLPLQSWYDGSLYFDYGPEEYNAHEICSDSRMCIWNGPFADRFEPRNKIVPVAKGPEMGPRPKEQDEGKKNRKNYEQLLTRVTSHFLNLNEKYLRNGPQPRQKLPTDSDTGLRPSSIVRERGGETDEKNRKGPFDISHTVNDTNGDINGSNGKGNWNSPLGHSDGANGCNSNDNGVTRDSIDSGNGNKVDSNDSNDSNGSNSGDVGNRNSSDVAGGNGDSSSISHGGIHSNSHNGNGSERNVETDDKDDAVVISFSHFLPRKELILGYDSAGLIRRKVTWNFSRIAGCAGLDTQIRQAKSRIHVYGHSHRNVDKTIDGVHYVGAMMGYPRERQTGACAFDGLKLIWDERSVIASSRRHQRG